MNFKYVLYILVLALLIFSACAKDEIPPASTCQQLTQNPDWITEYFKSDQTIQFPETYVGGVFGFEGYVFEKTRIDNKVVMEYFFCNPMYCVEYGDTLKDWDVTSIIALDKNNQLVTLANRNEICYDLVTVGIFYYSGFEQRVGKLYWLKDHEFRESLSVFYENSFQSEVEEILTTIKRI